MDGIASCGGTTARLVGEKLGVDGTGIGTGISLSSPSNVGLSTLGVEENIVDDWDELARSVVFDFGFFPLQGRGMVNDMGVVKVAATSSTTNTLLEEYHHGIGVNGEGTRGEAKL